MMYISNKKSWYSLGDPAIVREIGAQLKQMRLAKNLTQQQLADTAGVDRVTVSKVEHGRAATLLTFVQLLRALGQLHLLGAFEAEPEISPLKVAEAEATYRKRASGKSKSMAPRHEKRSEW